MNQIYNFEEIEPPKLTERELQAQLEVRKKYRQLRRQVLLLEIASVFTMLALVQLVVYFSNRPDSESTAYSIEDVDELLIRYGGLTIDVTIGKNAGNVASVACTFYVEDEAWQTDVTECARGDSLTNTSLSFYYEMPSMMALLPFIWNSTTKMGIWC